MTCRFPRHLLYAWCRRVMLLSISVVWLWWHGMTVSIAATVDGVRPDHPSPLIEQDFPSRSGLDASAISSEKVSQFVEAYLQVVALIERRESDLQGAETESESQQMQQEIQAEALALIESAGLTLQEYLQLLGLANIDPEFGERVAVQLQEAAN